MRENRLRAFLKLENTKHENHTWARCPDNHNFARLDAQDLTSKFSILHIFSIWRSFFFGHHNVKFVVLPGGQYYAAKFSQILRGPPLISPICDVGWVGLSGPLPMYAPNDLITTHWVMGDLGGSR